MKVLKNILAKSSTRHAQVNTKDVKTSRQYTGKQELFVSTSGMVITRMDMHKNITDL